ncbi:MAG: amino acid adenylation protein, partial [bacterium]
MVNDQNKAIHHIFEKYSENSPNHIAVEFKSKSLTYQELNSKSNQLAHYLGKLGVGIESKVAIYLKQSLEIVVAIFGVLKAGAAYVPIVPTYAKERLSFILEESEVSVILTQEILLEELSWCQQKILCLDKDWPIIDREPINNPTISVIGENLAYVIYTSGSTGKPKAVMITQIGITNLMVWVRSKLSLTSKDVLLQLAAISFDVAVWEICLPLVSGAKLVLIETEKQTDIKYLLEAIDKYEITVITLVPSLLSLMVEETSFSSNKLKKVISGGEALSYSLQESFFKNSKAELYNAYGPTETTIETTYWQCKPESKIIPIGSPVVNSQI